MLRKFLTLLRFLSSVKLLDWGEESHRSEAEIASLRAAFTQEVAVWHKLDHPNVTKVTFVIFTFSSPISSCSKGITVAEVMCYLGILSIVSESHLDIHCSALKENDL